jgi:hypothetical protein
MGNDGSGLILERLGRLAPGDEREERVPMARMRRASSGAEPRTGCEG